MHVKRSGRLSNKASTDKWAKEPLAACVEKAHCMNFFLSVCPLLFLDLFSFRFFFSLPINDIFFLLWGFLFCQLLHKQVHSTAPPRRAEPAYEKNAASNPSCDYVASSQNTKECSEKGSVAQVSIFSYLSSCRPFRRSNAWSLFKSIKHNCCVDLVFWINVEHVLVPLMFYIATACLFP